MILSAFHHFAVLSLRKKSLLQLICLLSLILLSSSGLFGQQITDLKPDKLRSSLHDGMSDLDRIDIYLKLASFYSTTERLTNTTDSGLFYYTTLLKLVHSSRELPSKNKIIAFRSAGIYYLKHGEKNKGIQNFMEAFSLQRVAKHTEEEISTISEFCLGFIANFPSQKDEVKPLLYRARALSKQLKNIEKEVYYRYFVSQTFTYCDFVS